MRLALGLAPLVALFAVSIACGASSDDPPATDAPSRSADVGPTVQPDASPPSSGDASAPSDPAGASCLFPPAKRTFTWTTGTSGPTTFYSFAPPKPAGLIVALHGTNGSATAVAEKKVEWASLFETAVARGYAVVVPESEQRAKPRQWDNARKADNPDVVRVSSLIDAMASSGAITASTPIYVMGMSQGGGVAGLIATMLAASGKPVRAVGVYCSGASSYYGSAQYSLPTTFALMANDSVANKPADVAANADALEARGVDVELHTQSAGRVCPTRFTRIPGIDAEASRAIFDGLVAGGAVAADGTVLAGSSDADDPATGLPGLPSAYAAYADAVSEQLRVVGAQHAFYGDRNAATLSFFDAHR